MKCDAVLSGKTYWYYSTVNMLVYHDITNKTYLENANLFWKLAGAKELFWDKKGQL